MASGPQSEVLGSIGDVPTTSEALRQWHHTIDLASNQDGQSSEIIPRQCHLPTIEEIVTGILEAKLGGSGNIHQQRATSSDMELCYELDLQYSHLGSMGEIHFEHIR